MFVLIITALTNTPIYIEMSNKLIKYEFKYLIDFRSN